MARTSWRMARSRWPRRRSAALVHRSRLSLADAARRRAERALAESERRYRDLVDQSLGLICAHDLDGTLLLVNLAAARSLGYDPAEGVGRDLREFLAAGTRHLFEPYLARIREHGSDEGLMRVVARDGSERVWMYRNVLRRDPGHPAYVLGHALDLTDRTKAEHDLRRSQRDLETAYRDLDLRVRERTAALEEANERLRDGMTEKENFLTTLSHELRTPVNAILGWARILQVRGVEPRTARAVDVIARNAEMQARLIEEILDVSRIVTGKLRLDLEALDLNVTVRAAIDVVRPAAEAKGVRFEAHLGPSLPLVVGDPHRLQQVVWNLLSNAVKFTDEGGLVTVTVSRSAENIAIVVTDSGIGITPAVLPFVFDRFRQADSSTTRDHGGLGLGLAIARHLVHLHGGTIAAASGGEGRGSTFTVELPVATTARLAAPQPARERPAGDSAEGARLRGRTVLVVEDNQDALELLADILESAGAAVIATASAREAVAAFERATPDLVLADIALPGEDGYTLLGRLRQLQPPGRQVPAIAVTAHARDEDRERALAAGFEQHMVKPVDPRELVEMAAAMTR